MKTSNCIICSNVFNTLNNSQKYCCKECSDIAKKRQDREYKRRNSKQINYERRLRYLKNRNFYLDYAKQMRKKYFKPKIYAERHCLICNKKFQPDCKERKFCSEQCRKVNKHNLYKKYRNKNSEKLKKEAKINYQKNYIYYKTYRKNNRIRILNRVKKYQMAHKKQRNIYLKNKKKIDVNYKLSCVIRSRINSAIKNKSKSSIELLGCSIVYVRKYLESMFTDNMSWQNHGKYNKNKKTWQIDHIRPCASFDLTKVEEQRKCFNYNNLQPLWTEENLTKGKSVE